MSENQRATGAFFNFPLIFFQKSFPHSHHLLLPQTVSESYAERAKIDGATLTIHSVTQKDSGEYRCEVTAIQDHVSLAETTVTLNVLGKTANLCSAVVLTFY